jgi:signal transduction histidine kinase
VTGPDARAREGGASPGAAAVPERNERPTAVLRVVVASTSLGIFFVDPSEHPARRPLVYALLAAYAAYGALDWALVSWRGRGVPLRVAPWLDAAWITLVVAASAATSGIFYPLYLFAILVASFGSGFGQGIAVTAASALGFALVGAATAPHDVDLRLFLIRPLYLAVLGYLIAVWGDHEARTRARMALLREVTALSNPRFGVEPAVGRMLDAIGRFFGADDCRLVIADDRSGERWMRGALRGRGAEPGRTAVPPDLAEVLLQGPADAAFLARADRGGGVEFSVVSLGGRPPREGDPAVGSALLATLDAGALISAPIRYHAAAAGRLYVIRRAVRPFERGEAEFLGIVLDRVATLLDSLRLVDRLASEATLDERRRIARDLHDSVIQPYLGLRLGLAAAQTALAVGRAEEARAQVGRLVEMADAEIQTLRGYVKDLREEDRDAGAGLDVTLRRFCRRFSEATGIKVELSIEGTALAGRMAAEVFHLVAEALSNVRRHTQASRADVRVVASADRLRLSVTNDRADRGGASFAPRSMEERALALGGRLEVLHPSPGATAVHVEIPL